MQYDSLVERVSASRAPRWMAARLRQVLIYPNVILFDGISTQVRTWRPLSPDETEVTVKCIAMKGESAEQREPARCASTRISTAPAAWPRRTT